MLSLLLPLICLSTRYSGNTQSQVLFETATLCTSFRVCFTKFSVETCPIGVIHQIGGCMNTQVTDKRENDSGWKPKDAFPVNL